MNLFWRAMYCVMCTVYQQPAVVRTFFQLLEMLIPIFALKLQLTFTQSCGHCSVRDYQPSTVAAVYTPLTIWRGEQVSLIQSFVKYKYWRNWGHTACITNKWLQKYKILIRRPLAGTMRLINIWPPWFNHWTKLKLECNYFFS